MRTPSLYLKAPWQTELRDVELPDAPAAGEALIRITACGICGSDLTAIAEGARDWTPAGHEIAGEIIALGPHAPSHLRQGQSVVLESSSFCGHCQWCRNGDSQRCNKGANFWTQRAMGFSRAMIAPIGCLVPYDGLTPDIACLAEPAGVAFDLVRTAGVRLGDAVCVVGPGPIGLMAIALAVASGAREVVCLARPGNEARHALARRFGARVVVADGPTPELLERFDHVLSTAPARLLPQAISMLAFGGILTYLGIGTGDGTVAFDANAFHFRKLQLRASFASPALYFPHVLDLLRREVLPGSALISHRFPLSRASEAFAASRTAGALKVVVVPD